MDETKQALQFDLNDKARACWRTVKEPSPSPVTVCPDDSSPGGLSADRKVLLAGRCGSLVCSVQLPFTWRIFTPSTSKKSISLRSRLSASSSRRPPLFSSTVGLTRFLLAALLVLMAAARVNSRPYRCGYGKSSPRSSAPSFYMVPRGQGICGKRTWFSFPNHPRFPKIPRIFGL
jgi:hypothetical protein